MALSGSVPDRTGEEPQQSLDWLTPVEQFCWLGRQHGRDCMLVDERELQIAAPKKDRKIVETGDDPPQ